MILKIALPSSVLVAVWMAMAPLAPSESNAQQISIAGSSTVKPIVDAAIKKYNTVHPEVRFLLGGGGSGQGIEAVGTGKVQIGMSSRLLKDEEIKRFPDLIPITVGMDGIAMVVHADNPVAKITKQQTRDVFTGKIVNWRDLGGKDSPITLISTNEKHGTFDAFVEHLGLEGIAREKAGGAKTVAFRIKGAASPATVEAMALDGNKPVLAALQTKRDALGYASLGFAQRVVAQGGRLRLLVLDDVAPSEDSMRDGVYPMQRPLRLLTKGQPDENVRQFVDFVASPECRGIIESLDYLPTCEGTSEP